MRRDEEEEYHLALSLLMLAQGGTAAATTTTNRRPSSSPPPSNLGPKLSYECSICDKTFPSYQALGGHKTNHRKLSNAADDLAVHFGNGSAGMLLPV
ncbi:Zinc finger protein ZAT10 [Acorus calamus]|uniref:Zinc finger protein ZAT10 n=1 Tax=Acorus calamus TaxID=4465 RepID=A0AAV9C7J0_ACOCL|nr:Zinc finger protein ZAT10 [Acorus calamus]